MTQPPYPPGDPNYGDPGQYPPPAGPPYGQQPSQQPYGVAPVGYQTPDDKTWAQIAHFGGILGFIPPLIAFLVKGPQSPTVRAHAVAALNFQIVCSAAIVLLVVVRTCGAYFLPWPVDALLGLAQFGVWIFAVVFAVLGGLKANQGQVYRYPIPVSIVK